MKRLAAVALAAMTAMFVYALPASAEAGSAAAIECGNHRTLVMGMFSNYWGNCTGHKVSLDVYLAGSGGEQFSHNVCVNVDEDKSLVLGDR
jgi:hypothetical protein